MKTKNFPERKNIRRRNAIRRGLEKEVERNTLRNIVVNAREIRTKKSRNKK